MAITSKTSSAASLIGILGAMRRSSIALLFCFGFAACSGGQAKTDPSALTLEEFEQNSEEAEGPPPDPTDNPDDFAVDECSTECLSDDDCCDGYYCGKDPERSQRKDYCLPGG